VLSEGRFVTAKVLQINQIDINRLPGEVNDRYLRYLAARISAFRNLWWSFANEYDLMRGRSLK